MQTAAAVKFTFMGDSAANRPVTYTMGGRGTGAFVDRETKSDTSVLVLRQEAPNKLCAKFDYIPLTRLTTNSMSSLSTVHGPSHWPPLVSSNPAADFL